MERPPPEDHRGESRRQTETGADRANVAGGQRLPGGDVFDESVRCIAFNGRLLIVGFTSGRIPSINVNMPLIKGFSVVGVRAGEYGRKFPEKGRENIAAVDRMLAEKKIRPHVYAKLPLSQAIEAMRLIQQRKVIGKVVIEP